MIELTFLKEFMIIKQVHWKNVKFATIGMSINLSNIGNLNIKGSDYCCILSLISKYKALSLMKMLIWLKKSVYPQVFSNEHKYTKKID